MTVQEAQVDDLHESEDEEFVDELTPGTQLMHGQYTIESFLNSGGFGITYLARDSLDRLVVIKECFPGSFCRRQNASVIARSRAHQAELRSIVRLFTQEARSLAKAGHPNIVGVHQVFEDNGTAYMALDYVEGMDLLEIITETPGVLTSTQIRGYLTKMLEAISFVHKQGILHRDISPDNILIRADNEPVLIDFGAAREQASKQSRLLSALRVVKDGYSPQEFYVAGSEQSPSCDLYSLAASFYHIITGELPPDSQTRLAAAAAGDDDPFVPLGKRTKDYDDVFCSSLDKAMAVLPRERIQSAEDWLSILKGDVPVAPAAKRVTRRPSTLLKVETPQAGKSKTPILLGSVAVVAIAAAGYLATQGGFEDTAVAPVSPQDTPFVAGAEAVTPPVAAQEIDVPAPEAIAEQEPAPEVLLTQDIIEITDAPTLPPAEFEQPFSNASALAESSAPVEAAPSEEVASAPLSLEGLPEGVELVLPEGVEVIAPETVAPVEETPVEQASVGEVQDLFIGDLPEGVELLTPAAPTETPVEAEPAEAAPAPVVTDIATLEGTGVYGGFGHAQLPFTLSETEPGVITSVTDGAPFWMAEGTRILSINGVPISTMAEANSIFEAASTAAESNVLQLNVATEAQVSGAAIDRVLTLPQVNNMILLNGLAFKARLDGDAWVTSVTAVPDNSTFLIGDELVAFMPTSERIEGPQTLKEIIERDLQAGRSNFSFAIQRDGQLWVESFTISN
ncbi:MAG: protein kinase [Silicimonas sp.]|nr:protein kinase [Silicimonas sp.]